MITKQDFDTWLNGHSLHYALLENLFLAKNSLFCAAIENHWINGSLAVTSFAVEMYGSSPNVKLTTLLEYLDSPEPIVREGAVYGIEAMMTLGEQSLKQELTTVLQTHLDAETSRGVRCAISNVLKQ